MAESPSLPELTKLQLQQSIETYRLQMSLLVQVCTVLILADASVVGYAIQQRLAGIIWVGALFPLGMLMIIHIVVRLTLPIVATAVCIETKYKDPAVPGLVSTFLSYAVEPAFIDEIRSAMDKPTEEERAIALAEVPKPYLHNRGHLVRYTLVFVVTMQLLVPFVLWRYAGWTLLIAPR